MKHNKRQRKKIVKEYQCCPNCYADIWRFSLWNTFYSCDNCGAFGQFPKKHHASIIPSVGDSVYVFHDGKSSPSRMSEVVINKVVPRKDAPQEWKDMFKEYGGDTSNWRKTKYFIEADWVSVDEDEGRYSIFTQDLFGGWYGLNYNGRLDVDREQIKYCCEVFGITEEEVRKRAELDE